MRWILALSLMLTACGGDDEDTDLGLSDEQSFDKKFGERYCEQVGDCNPDTPCDAGNSILMSEGCVFDEGYAQECLDGEYLCNDSLGEAFIEVPPVCALVYDCTAT